MYLKQIHELAATLTPQQQGCWGWQVGPEGPLWPSAPLMHHQCISLSHSTTYPAPQGHCTRERLALAPELANSSTNPARGCQCMTHCGLHTTSTPSFRSQTSAHVMLQQDNCIYFKGASRVSDTMGHVYKCMGKRQHSRSYCA